MDFRVLLCVIVFLLIGFTFADEKCAEISGDNDKHPAGIFTAASYTAEIKKTNTTKVDGKDVRCF